jgi:RNA polymerase sigma-70 factor (ECF subfamily)
MSTEAALHLPQALKKPTADPEKALVSSHTAEDCGSVRPDDSASDESLLVQVGKGSKDALGLLFRRHGRPAFNLAWRILRDESEAADLRQEVFLYLFERAKLFDPRKGSASSWIMQVTYHRAIDRRRYLDCRHHYKAADLDEQQLGITTNQSTDEMDVKTILNELRKHLTTNQQRTLELHFFEGYSFREIAERQGQSIGNVRHHYYRAIERLRSHLFTPKKHIG